MAPDHLTVTKQDAPFSRVVGTVYRAIDPRYAGALLTGSRVPGRYSRAHEPTLYLSSSPQGVEAAMIAHAHARPGTLTIARLAVDAERIVDLRDAESLRASGVTLADAMAPWQALVDAGETPRSWLVRDRLQELGATGLIDPSRKKPGLWHLALFGWNHPGLPIVTPLGPIPNALSFPPHG